MSHSIAVGDYAKITEGTGKELYTFQIPSQLQYLPVTTLSDENGNTVDYKNSVPAGTEYGLIVRQAGSIPTGSNTIGAVNQGTANVTPWNENIAQIGGSTISLGSKVSASSFPVVVASDQGAIPISAGSLPLPSGAATSALQSETHITTNASSVPAKVEFVGGSDYSGGAASNAYALRVNNLGYQFIAVDPSVPSGGPPLVTNGLGSLNASTGTIDAQVYLMPWLGSGAIQFTSGSLAGSVVIEGSYDGTNWSSLNIWDEINRQIITSIVNPASGSFYRFNAAGFTRVRGRVSVFTSGSVTGQLSASPVPFSYPVAITQAVSGTITANQGTANVTPWNMNNSQWGGTTTSLGQKVMASSVPITIASDQTSIPVAATLNAETTKVIGVTRSADGSGNLLSSTGGALNINISSGSIPTGANTIGAVTQSGTWTVAQGTANATPWNENLTQVGGSAILLKPVPTGGSGIPAIPVYSNAIQALSYTVGARAISTGTLTAGTAKAILSFEHSAATAKTVRLRRILVSGYCSTAVIGTLDIVITQGTAASTAGTGITPGVRVQGDTAATTTVKSLPTIVTSATPADTLPLTALAAATATAIPFTVIYDWQENGETKPWTLTASLLQSIVLNVISSAAQAWVLTIHCTFTEE